MENETGTERVGGTLGRRLNITQRQGHWCNPGKRGEKGEPMQTPLCLSQVGNDGEGGQTGIKKHNMAISSIILLLSVTTRIHSEMTGPTPLHLK